MNRCPKIIPVLAMTVACAYPALAQGNESVAHRITDAERGDDIVVTATRKDTALQKTPIAITALSSAALQNNRITDLVSLPLQVPSLYVGGSDGFGSNAVTIRGIGSLALGAGADEAVGIYIDGVYQGKPYGNVFEFVDIERVEVLRGPQGTLYGRNATGGAINFITKQPGNEFSGQANAEYSRFNGVNVSAYALVPLISDTLSLKIAAGSNTRDGWGYNPVRDEKTYWKDSKYASAILRFTPSEATIVTLGGRAGRNETGPQYRDVLDQTTSRRIVDTDFPGYDRRKFSALTLNINQDLGGAMLVLTSGYTRGSDRARIDSDSGPADQAAYRAQFGTRELTQAVRLVSNGSGPFSWLLGADYYHEKTKIFVPFSLPMIPLGILFDARLKTNSLSAYAEGTYKFADWFSVTAGARFTHEKKNWNGCIGNYVDHDIDFSPALCATARVPDAKKWNTVTPRFVMNFQTSDEMLVYASATRGFRSGGWNFTEATIAGADNGFDPEFVWSYELGLKSQWFDRRLKLNLAAFYADYTKLQVRVTDPATTLLNTTNAANARIYGIEAEANVSLSDAMDVGFTGSWIDAKYKTFAFIQSDGSAVDYSGNRLNRAPEWNLTVSAQYAFAIPGVGSLTPRAEFHYVSELFYSEVNQQPVGASPLKQVNLRMNFKSEDGRWGMGIFGDNITGSQFRTNAYPGTIPGTFPAVYRDPAIYGVRIYYNW
jgi:iron complex outermembrane recepter protein